MLKIRSFFLAASLLVLFACLFSSPEALNNPQEKKIRTLLENREFSKAEKICRKAKLQKKAYFLKIMADYLLFWNFPEKAGDFYCRAGWKAGMNRLGNYYFLNRDPDTARDFYARGEPSPERAEFYFSLAAAAERTGELDAAIKWYSLAHQDIHDLLRSISSDFTASEQALRKKVNAALNRLVSKKSPSSRKRLDLILKGAARYCRQLESQVYRFICYEDICEQIDRLWEIEAKTGTLRYDSRKRYPVRWIKNTCCYDYQLVQNDSGTGHSESRTKIRENGIRRTLENALLSNIFQIRQPIFAPIEFLSQKWQDSYEFRLLEDQVLKGTPVAVLEALPKNPSRLRTVSGTLYIDTRTFSVMRIDMVPRSVRNYQIIRKNARDRCLEPHLSFTINFFHQHRNLRFPSACTIEEKYTSPVLKQPFVRVKTEYAYRDYRFFQTSTQVGAEQIDEPLI